MLKTTIYNGIDINIQNILIKFMLKTVPIKVFDRLIKRQAYINTKIIFNIKNLKYYINFIISKYIMESSINKDK